MKVTDRDRGILENTPAIDFDRPAVDGPRPGEFIPIEEPEDTQLLKAQAVQDLLTYTVDVIDTYAKDTYYEFDPQERPDLAVAIERLFGKQTAIITYDMYLQALEKRLEVQEARWE